MPIICIEGPSAVGKTTAAGALEGAYVVPEANLLFARPADEGGEWYLERQVDRWAMAAWRSAYHPLAVLDGDPFQPLWYNWTYEFERWQDLDGLEAFYRPRLASGELGFPDRYVILGASAEALRRRKEGDAARQRRGFEVHLRLVEPQRRYFEAMSGFAPGLVRFVDADDAARTVRAVAEAAREARGVERPVELFDAMVRWLRENRPKVEGRMHGYAFTSHIQRVSRELLRVEEGSLYPALHRMEQEGWIAAEWGTTEKNRQARFYTLTPAGEQQLAQEQESWARLTEGVGRVLGYA